MINKKIIIFFTFLLFVFTMMNAQGKFHIVGKSKSVTIPFKLVNNLILLPVELNGRELIFILDTGVSKSLLFNIVTKDSIELKDSKKIRIKGLGNGRYFDALVSKNNFFKVNNLVNPNFEIYLILNQEFDFSARLGSNINGLIGTDFLKDYIVEINYNKKKVKFTKPESYRYRKCKKCQQFDLLFQNRKPYLDASISVKDNKLLPVKLLIDSGSGESLWLFNKSNGQIKIPKKNIDTYLGKGLSGNIFGKKGKINNFNIGNYKFENLIASYPDSTSIFYINKSVNRNGTFGSEILKRFHVILDYPNKKITLKKNSRFKMPFYYDKSGLEIIHNGKILVLDTQKNTVFGRKDDSRPTISYAYNYTFKNSYIIALVKSNSAAEIVGLKKDDVLIKINGKYVFEYTLEELVQKFSTNDGDKINLLINRNGFEYKFNFRLKDMF